MSRPYAFDPTNIGRRESSDGLADITVYVGIGNSDNKLSQLEWSQFVFDVKTAVDAYCHELYGWWFSAPDAPWQNACVGFRVLTIDAPGLRSRLAMLRAQYRQDSIAWAQAPGTEFL